MKIGEIGERSLKVSLEGGIFGFVKKLIFESDQQGDLHGDFSKKGAVEKAVKFGMVKSGSEIGNEKIFFGK